MNLFSNRLTTSRGHRSDLSSGRRFQPRLESLDDRLLPSVTFSENTSTHVLTLTAATGQNNNVNIVNDGNGGLRVVADGVTRNFTGINGVFVRTGDGADTVTYTQGSSTGEVDLRRSFGMSVDLGANASGTQDRFTANVFGDVGFFSNGAWQARTLNFLVNGYDGSDRIDINLNHDTDVRPGSTLGIYVEGNNGNDNITVDYDGEMDGKLFLNASGDNDNDVVAVNLHLDSGSSGVVAAPDDGAAYSGIAYVTGDLGNDNLTFAVRLDAGATARVNAILDGGFGFGWPDSDTGTHTTNVRTAFLEHDFVVQ